MARARLKWKPKKTPPMWPVTPNSCVFPRQRAAGEVFDLAGFFFLRPRLRIWFLLSNLWEDFSFQVPELSLLCCREWSRLPGPETPFRRLHVAKLVPDN